MISNPESTSRPETFMDGMGQTQLQLAVWDA